MTKDPAPATSAAQIAASSRRRWPLKWQLTALTAGLIVIAVAIIGGVSVGIQQRSLLDRLDGQVRVALDASARSLNDAQPEPPENQGPTLGPGPQPGSISLVIVNDVPLLAQLTEHDGTDRALSDDEIAALTASAGTADQPEDVDLGAAGEYRVAADSVEVMGKPATVISAHSLDEVTQTVRDAIITFVIVAVIAVIIALLVAIALISLGLRPLRRVAGVAAKVTHTPLTSGVVVIPQRVTAADSDGHTEVGQVGGALNTLLEHVEESLRIREQSEQRLRQFIADASHELRTPLTTIRGYADLVARADADLPQEISHSVQRIRSESVRMTALVDDLLLLARLDSGVPLRTESIQLAGLVVEACADARITATDHTWILELSDDAADLEVTGDPDRIRQVLVNLLANAGTHTPVGTTISTRLFTSADGRHAVLRVADDGPGISHELLPHIFDRFSRGDSARSRADGGTGLGTAIVEAIVRAHGGQVSVASDGGGTQFTVTLPINRTE
ncbi:sensor histidine kinase [Cumulibacter soli]|uniref:sensor histidine kinase n=1 Tax=Cumulibacter soli TaxID=2546344 RepID=UPI00106739EB|nr:HAMP domain-containing sensor histidine kinase [Cumulibacter soli]